MVSELTPNQQRLLDYLQRTVDESGRSPSLRQTAEDMGISHTAVAQTLKKLEDKGYLKRQGRYSREIYLINRLRQTDGRHRWREIPVLGRVTAGMPMYAQQEWEDTLVLDQNFFNGPNLFALRIRGDSMRNAGILDNDLAICEPRQYAQNGEIVVALIYADEDATVKRFFLHKDRIELRPENSDYEPLYYSFDQVLVQAKVIGIQRRNNHM
ncbi:MAG: transcriptional repressor LexA [Desulfobacteraceae bacterium]|nr:transcriptional repressor LexA [Desulfobacteraceae bacterium]